MKPDGRRYLEANNSTSGLIVSATLEETDAGSPKMTCKEIMNSRVAMTRENIAMFAATGMEQKNVRIWQTGDETFLEYIVPKLKVLGQKPVNINQENRFMCLEHDNVFVDLHVSKANFVAGDEKLFDPIFNSVQIHEGLVRTSMDYFSAGTAYYNQGDFKRAIPPYSQALAMEQQERNLEKNTGTYSWTTLEWLTE